MRDSSSVTFTWIGIPVGDKPAREEIRNKFRLLWKLIPEAGSEVWQYTLPASSGYGRRREALELLCGALWHLELASVLPDLPKQHMMALREGKKEDRTRLPWEAWLEQSKDLSAEFLEGELLVRYRFSDSSDPALSVLIQTMLIADATFRLDGARDVLRPLYERQNLHPLALAVRRKISKWLDKDKATFIPSVSALQRQVTIVVAFRDSYSHGEDPRPTEKPLWRFRVERLYDYSLTDIATACLAVWKKLVELASSQMAPS